MDKHRTIVGRDARDPRPHVYLRKSAAIATVDVSLDRIPSDSTGNGRGIEEEFERPLGDRRLSRPLPGELVDALLHPPLEIL
ncbi:MAG: hypothetical protein ACK56F_02355, partial [bacterium]